MHYADWQGVAATNLPSGNASIGDFPRVIRIDRPHDEYRLDMNVQKIALNEPLDTERFKLAPPAGAEVVQLGGAAEDKKP